LVVKARLAKMPSFAMNQTLKAKWKFLKTEYKDLREAWQPSG
jgi:hypothetical protein